MHWRSWFNVPVLWLLRSPLHGLMSRFTLAISVRGRITGRTYTVPVNYLQNGFTLLVLSPRDRTWWRNLQPEGPVTLWLRGHCLHATAQALTDPADVARGLLVFLRRSPRYQHTLGILLDGHGDPRDKLQLVRAASRYALVRIRFSGVAIPVVATTAAAAAHSAPEEFAGGRIV